MKKYLASLMFILGFFVFMIIVEAAVASYSLTGLFETSCNVGEHDYQDLELGEDVVEITLTGEGFGDRNLNDEIPENIYVPTESAIYDVYQLILSDEAFGLLSWDDNEIQFQLRVSSGDIGSYVILKTYSSPTDSQGTCVYGTVESVDLICTSFTYSDWSSCSVDGGQTRAVLTSLPEGCIDGDPVLTQACTPECVEDIWECGDWDSCSIDGSQTRSCVLMDDCDLVESDSPEVVQACTPECTEDTWECDDWGVCSEDGSQTRACSMTYDCFLVETSEPETTQSCEAEVGVEACTEDTWECEDWSICSDDGGQERSCYIVNDCDLVESDSPEVVQDCTIEAEVEVCTEDTWECEDWGYCSVEGSETRICSLVADCELVDTFVDTEQSCSPEPVITSLSPSTIYPGIEVTISGYEFGEYTNIYGNSGEILLGGENVDVNESDWSDTQVVFIVPEDFGGSSYVQVSLGEDVVSDTYSFVMSEAPVVLPEITSLSPQTITPGDTLTIRGTNFGDEQGYSKVMMDGVSSYGSVISWSDTAIEYQSSTFVNQSMEIGVKRCLSYYDCYDYVYGDYFYIHPEISSIDYDYNVVGENVIIYGDHLKSKNVWSDDSTLYYLDVFFNGVSATETVSFWADDYIRVSVPDGATDGYITIEITTDGTTDKVSATGPYFDVSTAVSNDEYSGYQDYFKQVTIPGAWSLSSDRREIVVAVIDSGVYMDHPDLENSIWENTDEIADNGFDDDGNGYVDDVYGWDFVSETNDITPASNHGTQVAGIIAAEMNNNEGMAGVNPNAKIMALKVSNSDGSTNSNYVQEAIHYAVDNGAEVINLSISSGSDTFTSAYVDAYDEPIKYAYDNNVLVVVAAGNGDMNGNGYFLDDFPQSPVCNNGGGNMVIGVGAVDSNDDPTDWSNYGDDCVDIWAPGEQILSTSMPIYHDGEFQDPYYQRSSGTSFSAPIVTGVVSLLKAEYEDLTSEEALYFLLNNDSWWGVLDAYATLKDADSNPPASEQVEDVEEVFDDVDGDSEYFYAIKYVKEEGIVEGYSDGHYRPEYPINRAEFTKILIGAKYTDDIEDAQGSSCLSDVVSTEWYAKYVCFAKNYEIIGGYPDGTFKPAQYINVAEALKITLETYFDDIPDVDGEWYQKYWDYADESGYLIWDSPSDYLTRGEMAELIYMISS